MKQIIFFLLFSIPLLAQSGGYILSGGVVYNDSLGYHQSDTLAVGDPLYVAGSGDSVYIINNNFNCDAFRVTLQGNSNTGGDSLGIKFGSIVYMPDTNSYNKDWKAVDTLWGAWIPVKDSANVIKSRMVNNTVGVDYFVYGYRPQLIRIELLNHWATLPTRNVFISVQGTKRVN